MAITSEPFGTYSLSAWREGVRNLASLSPYGKPGMWMISILRKISLLGVGTKGPFDIEVARGVKARLYPSSNRCEKRAFAGVHIWDTRERMTLDEAIANKLGQEEFVFLDVGANIGLYSLFVSSNAVEHGKNVKIIAVEPDEENRSRLTFNLNASQCSASVEAIGIADATGTGLLSKAAENRGGISILDSGDGVSIKLETLAGLFKRHKLTRIDAMKIDIEGRDEAALKSMTKDAPQSLWPKLLIVETGRKDNCPIVAHLTGQGYILKERAGINSILEFQMPTQNQKETAV